MGNIKLQYAQGTSSIENKYQNCVLMEFVILFNIVSNGIHQKPIYISYSISNPDFIIVPPPVCVEKGYILLKTKQVIMVAVSAIKLDGFCGSRSPLAVRKQGICTNKKKLNCTFPYKNFILNLCLLQN